MVVLLLSTKDLPKFALGNLNERAFLKPSIVVFAESTGVVVLVKEQFWINEERISHILHDSTLEALVIFIKHSLPMKLSNLYLYIQIIF